MPKDKPDDELDAVSAAYESISAKLEELRKKQAEASEDEPKNSKLKAKSSEDDDDGAIAEIDIDTEEEFEVEVTPKKKAKAGDEEELIEPLPGTEDEPELPKKQIYKADDPLDEEEESAESRKPKAASSDEDEVDEFESETETNSKSPSSPKSSSGDPEETEDEVMSLSARGAKLQSDADEMEKWEKMKSAAPEKEAEETALPKPTYQPLSQADFQSRLRNPADRRSAVSDQPSATDQDYEEADSRQPMADSSDEPDSLDDLADEPLEGPVERSFESSSRRPTEVDSLEDDWAIRRLKPQHKDSYENEERFDEIPQREFKRPQSQDDETYFDRRNQPLPRKKASIWHLLVLVLIGVGVIGATVYVLKYQFNEPAKPAPSPEIATPPPSATPTPTPVPVLEDKAAFRVRVLNGTSKTGLAGSVLAKLKSLGYQSDRAGNADNDDYQQTVIKVKEGTQSAALINTITQDLGTDYSPTSETTLKDTDRADVEIILGLK